RQWVHRRRAERVAAVFRGLEDREAVAVESLEAPAGPVTITGVQALASFNKVSDGEIAVPGAPPRLYPLTQPLRIAAESEKNGPGDGDDGRYPQYAHIFEPLLRSVELMRPGFDLGSAADVVSSATNLRKLFDVLQNRAWAVERLEVEMRGGAVLLARWGRDPNLSLDLGCGTRFERATCRHDPAEDPVLRRSMSHHLVVAYAFGGLRCVVQGEVDAYHCDHDHDHDHGYHHHAPSPSPDPPPSPPPSRRQVPVAGRAKRRSDPLPLLHRRRPSAARRPSSGATFAALTLDDPGESAAFLDRPRPPPTARTTRASPTLLVHHAGRPVPPGCLVEVKTRNARSPPFSSDEAQLYFARRPQLYLARHERGLFRPELEPEPETNAAADADTDLASTLAAAAATATLGRLAALLARVRQRAAALRARGVRRVSLVCESDGSGRDEGIKLRLCER
ncbi:uncharacterized protein P884DRAFT_167811, partial [Thermothelomyces heterothallicus CBS 202.75]|uniref:uncharacterized protein n=1 Tax=Thermothelomyces heterothallicus CBS 202.75 TaxID=1149848 RepID=UPI0037445356